MTDKRIYEDALANLERVQQSLKSAGSDENPAIEAVDTYMLLHIGAVTFAVGLGVCESAASVLGFSMTQRLLQMASPAFASGRLPLIETTGIVLSVLCAFAYVLILFRARQERQTFTEYNKKHFSYFRNFAAVSDLTIKFVIIALLILAGKPEWVAGVSVLLIADVIMQARVLTITSKAALIVGIASYGLGFGVLFYAATSLLWPIGLAAAASIWSLGRLLAFRSRLIAGEQ